MRISDWSSDVCSSDLLRENPRLDLIPPLFRSAAERKSHRRIPPAKVPVKTVFPRIQRLPPYVFNIVGDLKTTARADRKGVVQGQSVSVRVDTGGRGLINKKTKEKK